MPRMPLSDENKSESVFDYPKLRLSKNDKHARILFIEPDPLFGYTHNLRAPQIVDGRVVMETVNKFGSEVQQVKTDFIGSPLCLGRVEVLQKKSIDPEECPACAIAATSDAIDPPKRRFASHVIQYTTKPGSPDVAEPFGVKLVAWVFGDKVFNQLVGFKNEWGDLRKHDLMLGPLVSEQFQTYDIAVSGKAEWLANDERKALVARTFKENQSPNLEALIGRSVTREKMEEDISRVMTRYRQAYGTEAAETPDEADVDATLDVEGLFASNAPEETPVVDEPETGISAAPEVSEDTAADDDDLTSITAEVAEESGETGDLEDILASLDS